MDTQAVNQNAGVVNTIKEYANPANWMEKFNMSKERLIEVGLYGGIGFLVGFLLKKCSTYVFTVVLCVVGLIAMHQFEMVNIAVSWDKVYQIFGMQPAAVTDGNALTVFWEWVKANSIITLSFIVGFLGGLKLG